MKQKRYIIVKPVKGGYSYYDINDRWDEERPNFTVVSVHRSLPKATSITQKLCDELNGK